MCRLLRILLLGGFLFLFRFNPPAPLFHLNFHETPSFLWTVPKWFKNSIFYEDNIWEIFKDCAARAFLFFAFVYFNICTSRNKISKKSVISEMPKFVSKFSSAMLTEFPFLKAVDGIPVRSSAISETANLTLQGVEKFLSRNTLIRCSAKAAVIVTTNQTMASFSRSDPASKLLHGKELAFAFHWAKHQKSKQTTECN